MNKLQIKRVWIEHKPDEMGNADDLGTFTDSPESTVADRAIVRYGEHKGKLVSTIGDDEWPAKSREFRFFVPAMTGDETGNPESPVQDWQRAESLNRGEWNFLGVIAKAEIWNPETQVLQVIRSGGLWGIESDSGNDYLGQVAIDELAGLRQELEALGFGARAIAYAFSNVQSEPIVR